MTVYKTNEGALSARACTSNQARKGRPGSGRNPFRGRDRGAICQRALASQANWLGIFDAVVHKAPVGYWEEKQRGTVECRRMFSPSASGPYADAANSRLKATAAKRQGEARRGEAPAAPSRSYRRLAIMRW